MSAMARQERRDAAAMWAYWSKGRSRTQGLAMAIALAEYNLASNPPARVGVARLGRRRLSWLLSVRDALARSGLHVCHEHEFLA